MMLQKQCVFYTIFLFVTSSQELELKKITVKEGDSVNLECKLKENSQFDFCEFEHEIKNKRLKCIENEKIIDKCDIKLENLTFKDIGRWRCHCGNTNYRKNTVLQNEIMLRVTQFNENEIIGMVCLVVGGIIFLSSLSFLFLYNIYKKDTFDTPNTTLTTTITTSKNLGSWLDVVEEAKISEITNLVQPTSKKDLATTNFLNNANIQNTFSKNQAFNNLVCYKESSNSGIENSISSDVDNQKINNKNPSHVEDTSIVINAQFNTGPKLYTSMVSHALQIYDIEPRHSETENLNIPNSSNMQDTLIVLNSQFNTGPKLYTSMVSHALQIYDIEPRHS